MDAYETVVAVPSSATVFDSPSLVTFNGLVERRQELKALSKLYEEEVRDLDKSISTMLTERDTVKVQHGGYAVSLVMSVKSTLDKDRLKVEMCKLLPAARVAEVITASSKVSQSTYVLVTTTKRQ